MKWIIFFIGALVLFGGMIVAHESAHLEAFRLHGIDANIYYGLTEEYIAITIPNHPCVSLTCISDQNRIDAIGYHLFGIYWLIVVGFTLIIFTLEEGRIK